MLYYREDVGPPSIGGELQILDAGAGVQPWQAQDAKMVSDGDVCATLGYWLRDVFAHIGDQELHLEIELFLPRKLLTPAAYDTAEVRVGEEDLRLGEDHPALLRCFDRYKSRIKRQRLIERAPAIFARMADPPAAPLCWALLGQTPRDRGLPFIIDHMAAPVWLAFDPQVCGDEGPLDDALEQGLPAVLWLRVAPDAADRAALEADLGRLLRTPIHRLPAALKAWRQTQTEHAQRSVALLLDDPKQLPAVLSHQMTQPGG